ncbi:hypothetical protein BDM02DRAFT_3189661 [Thelephora ganbajun]|uniref:Uncharacterized protein n=1 Tax=Thelephora ganbajun TaxID=370292 RepID=A0ACB6Z711_THEGA|nr:hypothetical protein BDM02DRAFT_3189661 [Thelephora ganbajun]
MPYKVVVNAEHPEKEEAIRETPALTTRGLSNEEQCITASSDPLVLFKSVTAAETRAQDETNYVTEAYPTKVLLSLSTATLSHNFLGCPVGSIPVTRVDPEFDVLPEDWSTTTRSSTPLSKE